MEGDGPKGIYLVISGILPILFKMKLTAVYITWQFLSLFYKGMVKSYYRPSPKAIEVSTDFRWKEIKLICVSFKYLFLLFCRIK